MAGTNHVLVLSGDGGTLEELSGILRELDSDVHAAASTHTAAAIARRHSLSVVIADIRGVPDQPHKILTQLRRHTSAPVLMLTDDDSDLAGQCLEFGADDCLTWPASPRELLARIRRRMGSDVGALSGLALDPHDRTVGCAGRTVTLTDREFDLLSFMAASAGEVFSTDQLLDAVWGSSREWQSISTIKEHIYRLRNKLEADPGDPELIVTVRGHGYRLEV